MFHLHLQYRSRDGGGSCDSARQYIAREERFAGRGDSVRWVRSLHMPTWAGGGSAAAYWKAAESKHSRANARTALFVEFALPKNLTRESQDALALQMAEQLSAMAIEDGSSIGRLPVTLAIHEGHGRNPHVHVLVSTSINDGVARDDKTWFRRFLPTKPEKGGARRSSYITKRRWVHHVRQAWARLANGALALRGLPSNLDHRSNAARGLATQPQIHLGPRIAHMARQGIGTSRGARHADIEKRNEEQLALEASILRRRKSVRTAELNAAVLRQAELLWAAMRDREWQHALAQHPMVGGAAELKVHATALVIESDLGNTAMLREAFYKNSKAREFAAAVGPAWDTVVTDDAIWAVRPGSDHVVMTGPALAAIDGDDESSVDALINGALTQPFKNPVLMVRDSLHDFVSKHLQKRGITWPVMVMKAPTVLRKNRPGA
ncbi:MobA/MobL family protein [Polaromonas sp. P2-4]|nr:MobA/MobL family protein [Polaromonas sp. P2-4]